METKRLSSEVLNRLAKLDMIEIKENNKETINELTFDVFNELIDSGFEVVISKPDLAMLFSLDVNVFKKTINDQIFKNTQAATPIT